MAQASRFLVEGRLGAPGEYALGRQESHHAVNVLRHGPGDAVIVFDGVGNYAEAAVVSADKNAVRVLVDSIRTEERLPLVLTIATAIPKGKRWQMLVEKCTELGVDDIMPVLCERSVAKGEGDVGKWRRWMLEAAKQSRRAWLPTIREPQPLARTLALAGEENALVFVADAGGESPRTYAEQLRNARKVVALIGPEGGFAEEEMAQCLAAGANPVCLSPFVLRVETAATIFCAMLRELPT